AHGEPEVSDFLETESRCRDRRIDDACIPIVIPSDAPLDVSADRNDVVARPSGFSIKSGVGRRPGPSNPTTRNGEASEHGLPLVVEGPHWREAVVYVRVMTSRRVVGEVSDEKIEVVAMQGGTPEFPGGVDLLQGRSPHDAAERNHADSGKARAFRHGRIE